MDAALILILILLPTVAGVLLPLLEIENRKRKYGFITAVLVIEAVLACVAATRVGAGFTLWELTDELMIGFHIDDVSVVFSLIAAFGWLLVGIYAYGYMTHLEKEDRFFCFFLMVEGMLMGMDFAADLVTMYCFYELLTLSSVPLVLHSLQKEAISAAMKFLFYSIAGAFMALFGIFVLSDYVTTFNFVPGGALDLSAANGHEGLILAVTLVAIIGCGAKAGLYPLHGWLPAAHPVAPAPASAVLSAIIAKAGVLAIFRIIYYSVGADFLRGTWMQTVLLTLSLITVFMGSMMAYREKLLKKRFAYSTVSQISYILSGLFLMSGAGAFGALLHTSFHAIIKTGLFLVAGSVIFATEKTRVDELRGIGRKMPFTMASFAALALALVGIPPLCGFVSKWYLAEAALMSGLGTVSWLMPVILLISALLTAGYLLPIAIDAFFPGSSQKCAEIHTAPFAVMKVPVVILAAIAFLFGIWPNALAGFFSDIVSLL